LSWADWCTGICPHGSAAKHAAQIADGLKPSKGAKTILRSSAVKTKSDCTAKFDYEAFYSFELEKKHKDRSYRYFNNINRLAGQFPQAHLEDPAKLVTSWCSNDYVSFILFHVR
jgi:5-aminolevulinate synthase